MTWLVLRRSFSTRATITATTAGGSIRVTGNMRTNIVFGANTDVGKTIVSTGLVRSALQSGSGAVHYIKPLQSGGSDEAFVREHVLEDTATAAAAAAAALEKNHGRFHGDTLFTWQTPTSPHTAAKLENHPVSDDQVLSALRSKLVEISVAHRGGLSTTTTIVETAGGVLTPAAASPSNASPGHSMATTTSSGWGWKTQADLYQPLLGAAPVVLVGDGRLGGISSTLSSLESLILRGYDVAGLVLLENGYDNVDALREYASRQFKLRSGTGSALFEDPNVSIISLPAIPPMPSPLYSWFESAEVTEKFAAFTGYLDKTWKDRVTSLESMRSEGRDTLWWPFTQHGNVDDDNKVTLIDSAAGDKFEVVRNGNDGELVRDSLMDSCASWWTQGVGHGEPSIALAAAAAAGRYGHVIFPDIVHAPALELSKKLIGPQGPGHGWANRVFFSDDGSTAMEVAIKMGMKTFQKWNGLSNEDVDNYDWLVCAQQDCYHGDTLGVMDVAEPSVFNEGQHPWYEPKGLFLYTPTLGYVDGELRIMLEDGTALAMNSRECVMNVESRLGSRQYHRYIQSIERSWADCEDSVGAHGKPRRIGSLVIEPVLIGAGGMKFVDPLWQRALIDVARERRVPVVFDEIAAGIYRVGACSCREILGANPDVASYAKLLTGGLMTMSVTLATEDVFNTFLGDQKGQALLHGHSYTASPIGCASAIHALESYDEVLGQQDSTERHLFDLEQVKALSHLPLVQQSFSLGTVLAVTIMPEDGAAGYAAASRTVPMARALREEGIYSRPLGNVLYIMASPMTSRQECARLADVLRGVIERFNNEDNKEDTKRRSAA